MEKKKKATRPRLEDLIPDENRRAEVMNRLYQGDPIVGNGGIFTDMLQALVNAALEGEMDYTLHESKLVKNENRRNGHTHKTVTSRVGPLDVNTPRDRRGEHEPILVKKWDRDLGTGLDEIILSLYARGQSVEDVRYQLRELYGVEVSAGAITAVTDRVWSEILEWQQRPLSPCYPIVYLDAIFYKVRDDGRIIGKAVYTAYGVTIDGKRDILGFYLNESEGSRQWGLILEDIKRRGVEDVFFFCIDGLAGFKKVIEEVYPFSIIQRCIVHIQRQGLMWCRRNPKRPDAKSLRRLFLTQFSPHFF